MSEFKGTRGERIEALRGALHGIDGSPATDAEIIEFLEKMEHLGKLKDAAKSLEHTKKWEEAKRKAGPGPYAKPKSPFDSGGIIDDSIFGPTEKRTDDFRKKLADLMMKKKAEEPVRKPTVTETINSHPQYRELCAILTIMRESFDKGSKRKVEITWDCNHLAGMAEGGLSSSMMDHSVIMFRLFVNGVKIMKEEWMVSFESDFNESIKMLCQRILISLVCSGVMQMVTISGLTHTDAEAGASLEDIELL